LGERFKGQKMVLGVGNDNKVQGAMDKGFIQLRPLGYITKVQGTRFKDQGKRSEVKSSGTALSADYKTIIV
jgi:hypothetical protein